MVAAASRADRGDATCRPTVLMGQKMYRTGDARKAFYRSRQYQEGKNFVEIQSLEITSQSAEPGLGRDWSG